MNKTIINALTEGFTHPVRDVLWGHVYMTEKMSLLTESAPFKKLTRIFQLGPVFHVYPGATHTRASHSIGVYHLGFRLLQNLVEKGASDWLSYQGVKSFLAACLLHDLGHFPYTHSLKDLPLLADHETLTGKIIMEDPMKNLVGAAGADPSMTAAIVDKDIPQTDSEVLFYRKLLSGALDPDKLDYLNRDARYCGVPYGAQDVDFILSRLHPCKERGADIDSRLIPNVESILFSKYLMYRTVYWHKHVRSATAMIKKTLISGLENGKITPTELYNLDDHSLFALLKDSDLAQAVREGLFFHTALEIPYDQEKLKPLRDTKVRTRLEERFAGELGVEELIIDLPEPASFETGLYVVDEKCGFSESSSAFKTEMVNAFIQTLYTVRIFIDQKYKDILKTNSKSYDIFNKLI